MNNTEKGHGAEVLIEKKLISEGYMIVDKNVKFHNTGELDIVALKNNILVFVEVRSLFFNEKLNPLETVGKSKKYKLLRAINLYLDATELSFEEVRIDVASVKFSKKHDPEVIYVENGILSDEFYIW